MNNLVESVRYGLKYLLNNEENLLDHELFNNLLQVKDFWFLIWKIIQFMNILESSKIEFNLCEKYSSNEM